MALRTYVNGAWQDISDFQTPEINGARETAESANSYVSGAWQEAWSAIKWMKQLANTFAHAGGGQGSENGKANAWHVWCTGYNEEGYATYYVDGNFVNPVVTLDCFASFSYLLSTGERQFVKGGDLYIYTRTASGAENYQKVTDLGKLNGTLDESFTVNLKGTFSRVGYKIDFTDWQVTGVQYWTTVENFCIDGKLCVPSKEYEF